MEAQELYIQIMHLSIKCASNLSRRRIHEINNGIVELRQLLSCAVCMKLLNDPYKPKGRRCGHYVCRLCLRGRKKLVPTCSQCNDCSDFRTYEESKLMAKLLLCYKTLCVYLRQSSFYSDFYNEWPEFKKIQEADQKPRIKLPVKPTKYFILEGANYENMCDTFIMQPDLPFLSNIPASLPAETPPTTAATTPELPFEPHLPNQLSINDMELEAAATGDHAQFGNPLPMMTPLSGMMNHNHIAPQPQVVIPSDPPLLPSGYIEAPWTDQVDLSGAFQLPTDYANSTPNYTTYIMNNGELHDCIPSIGRVVRLPQQLRVETVESVDAVETVGNTFQRVEPVTSEQTVESTSLPATAFQSVEPSNTLKRRHAQMLLEEVREGEHAPTSRFSNVSNKKATIISSVQVKPPTAALSPIITTVPVTVDPLTTTVQVAAAVDAPLAVKIPVDGPAPIDAPGVISAPLAVAAPAAGTVPLTITNAMSVSDPSAVPVPITVTVPAIVAPASAGVAIQAAPGDAATVALVASTPLAAPVAEAATIPVSTAVTAPAVVAAPPAAVNLVGATVSSSNEVPTVVVTTTAGSEAAAIAGDSVPKASSVVAKEDIPIVEPVVVNSPVAKPTVAALPNTSTPNKARDAPVSRRSQKPKPKDARMAHICRCGTTSAPGKATCRNSRCTCYVAGKSCVDCKCVGCKNPHKDATDSSDDEDYMVEMDQLTESTEGTPKAAAPATTVESKQQPAKGIQSGITLVPLSNLQQSQHPLVLVVNESGQYQGFNIFNGTEPVDPAQLGFQRVPLQTTGNASVLKFAYIMPPTPAVEPAKELGTKETTKTTKRTLSPAQEPLPKRYKNLRSHTLAAAKEAQRRNSPVKSADVLFSAGSTSNVSPGDSFQDEDIEEMLYGL